MGPGLRGRSMEFFECESDGSTLLGRSEHGEQTLFEIFLRELLVQPAVGGVPQAHASDTLAAVHAVTEEEARLAVDAVSGEEQRIASETFVALVTALAPADATAIDAGQRILNPVAVHAILIEAAAEQHVAVLVVCRIERVVGVLTVHVEKIDEGGALQEGIDLIEYWMREIDLLSVFPAVPRIGPPRIIRIDGEGLVGRIGGDDGLAREVTRAVVEFALIAERTAPLVPAGGAEGWWRDQLLLPGEDR